MCKRNWVALQTLLYKEVHRFTRIWVQTLAPVVMNATLYCLIFGHFIGHRIGTIQGHSYLQFILPGLIMMSAITNAYSNVASSFYSAKFQHSIEELLVAPVSINTILWGYVGGGVIRGLLTSGLVMLTTCLWAPLPIAHGGVVTLVLLLTTLCFSLCGLLNGLFATSFDDASIISTLILTPLSYLGGVFYSLSLLPPTWQYLSQLNPLIYMVNGLRFGCLGVSDVPLFRALMILSSLTLLLYLLLWQLMKRGVGLRT